MTSQRPTSAKYQGVDAFRDFSCRDNGHDLQSPSVDRGYRTSARDRWRLSIKATKKTGGRVKGVPNKATRDLKDLLDCNLPDEELWKLWEKKLYPKNEQIATKALEMALHYRFGKPVQPLVGVEDAAPIRIDISAIPKFRVPAQK